MLIRVFKHDPHDVIQGLDPALEYYGARVEKVQRSLAAANKAAYIRVEIAGVDSSKVVDGDVRGAEEALYVGFHGAYDCAAALAHQAAYIDQVRQLVAGFFDLIFEVAALFYSLRRKILYEYLLVAFTLRAGKIRSAADAAEPLEFPAALKELVEKRRELRVFCSHVRSGLLRHVSCTQDLQYRFGTCGILCHRGALGKVLF